ncbi:terminase small subunit [bacterium]|nr:terminase small subunit [bacterium]
MITKKELAEVNHDSLRGVGVGLLNKGQLAQKLGVSARSIDAWMKLGRLPYLKIGGGQRGTVRFEYSAVMDSLRQHQVGGSVL